MKLLDPTGRGNYGRMEDENTAAESDRQKLIKVNDVLMKQVSFVRVIYYFLARCLPRIHIMYPLALLVAPTSVKPLLTTTTTPCINTSNINVLICHSSS